MADHVRADHVRERFLAWVSGSTRLPAYPTRSDAYDQLEHDRTRLPAALRFGLSECDVVTVAHAARLLRRLDEQGMLAGHDSVGEALRAVPPCILHDSVRIVEESLRAEARVGVEPRTAS